MRVYPALVAILGALGTANAAPNLRNAACNRAVGAHDNGHHYGNNNRTPTHIATNGNSNATYSTGNDANVTYSSGNNGTNSTNSIGNITGTTVVGNNKGNGRGPQGKGGAGHRGHSHEHIPVPVASPTTSEGLLAIPGPIATVTSIGDVKMVARDGNDRHGTRANDHGNGGGNNGNVHVNGKGPGRNNAYNRAVTSPAAQSPAPTSAPQSASPVDATLVDATSPAVATEASSTAAASSSPAVPPASSPAVQSVQSTGAASSSTSDVPVVSATASSLPSSVAGNTTSPTANATAAAPTGVIPGAIVDNKILVLARDAYGAESAYLGLEAYGIPYEVVLVPSTGITLPAFTSAANHGLYSGIMVMDALAYQYGNIWASALTVAQWDALHNYQIQFNARMVRFNEYPGPDFGVSLAGAGGCCDTGVEQLMSLSDTTDFPTANLKIGATVSSKGLWHYPATVVDTATTKTVAKFGASGSYADGTTAAVINNFGNRQQWIWFSSWAPQWSLACAYLDHAHIHWMTRGVFIGKRKTHLSAQIDDLELETDMYFPNGTTYRVTPAELTTHVQWQQNLNSRLPAGSDFRLELGHNGNGDLIKATGGNGSPLCNPNYPIDYAEVPDTALEFMKPLGTGADFWSPDWTVYNWTRPCTQVDPLTAWYSNAGNRDAFAHVSHTFTHLELNNATYRDAAREIQFNQAWLAQTGISTSPRFSPGGIIPPAITGLHNGDVIKAWMDNGIIHVVGDNTRPVLRNPNSPYWPLISTTASNGYDGLTIVPRFATRVFYNCHTTECDVNEWHAISATTGTWDDLIALEKESNVVHLLTGYSDPYMFHQANLHVDPSSNFHIGTQSGKMSMVMAWSETIAQEMARLTNWPIISLGHDDIAKYFLNRMALDGCNPTASFTYSGDGKSITSITVGANGNSCSVPIPVTIPGGTLSGGSVTNDQVGSEPPIQWVQLSGSSATLSFSAPVLL